MPARVSWQCSPIERIGTIYIYTWESDAWEWLSVLIETRVLVTTVHENEAWRQMQEMLTLMISEILWVEQEIFQSSCLEAIS